MKDPTATPQKIHRYRGFWMRNVATFSTSFMNGLLTVKAQLSSLILHHDSTLEQLYCAKAKPLV